MRSTVNDASQSDAAGADTRGQAILYPILLPRRRHCGRIPQSLRWRVLDPRGYVVGCTGRETDRAQPAKATGPSDSIRAPLTRPSYEQKAPHLRAIRVSSVVLAEMSQ